MTEVRRFSEGIKVVRRATDEGAQVQTFVSFWDLSPTETRSSRPPPCLRLSSTAVVRHPPHRGCRSLVSLDRLSGASGGGGGRNEDVKEGEQPEQKESIAKD